MASLTSIPWLQKVARMREDAVPRVSEAISLDKNSLIVR